MSTAARKAAATRRKREREEAKLRKDLAKKSGELAAYKKLIKDGWAPAKRSEI